MTGSARGYLPRIPRTCRHCGASTPDSLTDHRVGATCCEDAVRDQRAWREQDLDRLRADARRMLDAAEARAATVGPDAAARIREGAQARIRGELKARADELKAELQRCDDLLTGAAEWPRPYADG